MSSTDPAPPRVPSPGATPPGTDVAGSRPPLDASRYDACVRLEDLLSLAAAKIIGRHLVRLRDSDPGTRAGEDPEALHDMRVASRRLRAAVGHFRRAIPVPVRARLTRDLRWLGALLGTVRDLDVQRERLKRASSLRPPRERRTLARLATAFADEHRAARERLLAGLQSRLYFRLLEELERFASARAAGEETLAERAARSVRRALRRFERAAEETVAEPSAERLHGLRIAAKRLRYLLESLGEALGEPGRRPLKRLVALQDLLGAHQDAMVSADRVLAFLGSGSAPDGVAERACLEAIVGREHLLARRIRATLPVALRPLCGKRAEKWRERLLEVLPLPPTRQSVAVDETQPT